MDHKDFLVELGTEELPPKALSTLIDAFSHNLIQQVEAAGLSFSGKKTFATPRRLGLLLTNLSTRQPDKSVERKGPAVETAFKDGQATPAAKGFARSCGVDVEALETLETNKGAWLVFRSTQPGKTVAELLPGMVETALNELPIPKRMRWGTRRDEFIRPAHWLVMLLGADVVECTILGLQAGRETFGHRIHSQGALTINAPAEYETLLETSGKVIVDFERRKKLIKTQAENVASKIGGQAVIETALLSEVTGLVEWPVAIAGSFDQDFLKVPAEVLMSSMQAHQKYFPVVDSNGHLLPHFICIANLESKDMAQVIAGNERVIRPRLADAQFFYDTDLKTTLEDKREKLKTVVFQKQLGSIFDKTERVAKLAERITQELFCDRPDQHLMAATRENAGKAARLSKSDLVSEMVLEFPELQGIMGRYYAQAQGLNSDICTALEEQYLPRFSGDKLPSTNVGCAVAIADKMDTLVGIFGIKQPPSGNKDPFALRRATLGILRIIIEKTLPLKIDDLIDWAQCGYNQQDISFSEPVLKETVAEFMFDRLRSLSQNDNIPAQVFLAVKNLKPTPLNPGDFYHRMQAVKAFSEIPEAETLAQANKRVANIMAKAGDMIVPDKVDASLLSEPAEQSLYKALQKKKEECSSPVKFSEEGYKGLLMTLATLKQPVDNFFDQVLVNTEDDAIRMNRYALLNQLRNLFLQVADIAFI